MAHMCLTLAVPEVADQAVPVVGWEQPQQIYRFVNMKKFIQLILAPVVSVGVPLVHRLSPQELSSRVHSTLGAITPPNRSASELDSIHSLAVRRFLFASSRQAANPAR